MCRFPYFRLARLTFWLYICLCSFEVLIMNILQVRCAPTVKGETPIKPTMYNETSTFVPFEHQSHRAPVGRKKIAFQTNKEENKSSKTQQEQLATNDRFERMQHIHRVLLDRAYEIQRQTSIPFAKQCRERFDGVRGWKDGAIDFPSTVGSNCPL